MLCAGLPSPFCNTTQSMASQICDDSCTHVGGAKGSIVGRYPQQSGEVSTGMISSIFSSLVKSGDLISMQKL
jgi:hypothetical protein